MVDLMVANTSADGSRLPAIDAVRTDLQHVRDTVGTAAPAPAYPFTAPPPPPSLPLPPPHLISGAPPPVSPAEHHERALESQRYGMRLLCYLLPVLANYPSLRHLVSSQGDDGGSGGRNNTLGALVGGACEPHAQQAAAPSYAPPSPPVPPPPPVPPASSLSETPPLLDVTRRSLVRLFPWTNTQGTAAAAAGATTVTDDASAGAGASHSWLHLRQSGRPQQQHQWQPQQQQQQLEQSRHLHEPETSCGSTPHRPLPLNLSPLELPTPPACWFEHDNQSGCSRMGGVTPGEETAAPHRQHHHHQLHHHRQQNHYEMDELVFHPGSAPDCLSPSHPSISPLAPHAPLAPVVSLPHERGQSHSMRALRAPMRWVCCLCHASHGGQQSTHHSY